MTRRGSAGTTFRASGSRSLAPPTVGLFPGAERRSIFQQQQPQSPELETRAPTSSVAHNVSPHPFPKPRRLRFGNVTLVDEGVSHWPLWGRDCTDCLPWPCPPSSWWCRCCCRPPLLCNFSGSSSRPATPCLQRAAAPACRTTAIVSSCSAAWTPTAWCSVSPGERGRAGLGVVRLVCLRLDSRHETCVFHSTVQRW